MFKKTLKLYLVSLIILLSSVLNVRADEFQIVENIGTIQGSSHKSTYENQKVTVKDVVVTQIIKDKKNKNKNYGFYIQDKNPDQDPKTSDALLVKGHQDVEVNDVIEISGTVKETPSETFKNAQDKELTLTTIIPSKIKKTGHTHIIQPIEIIKNMPKDIVDNDGMKVFDPSEDALDYYESLEAMLVKINTGAKILGPTNYGDAYVLDASYKGDLNYAQALNLDKDKVHNEILLVKTGNSKFSAKAGDYFNQEIVGNVTYDYGEYKIDARGFKSPTYTKGTIAPNKTTFTQKDDAITIASYNVENFSAIDSQKETPQTKVKKIAQSIISDLNNPDIINLIEIGDDSGTENDGTVSGQKSGQRLIDEIKAQKGVDYQYAEIAPKDNSDGGKKGLNIRLAFLYNPSRVQLLQKTKGNSESVAKLDDHGELINNPSRLIGKNNEFAGTRKPLVAQFKFKNQKFMVIANHLSSKIGDDAIYGNVQPPVQHSLKKRLKQAKVINDFIKEVKSKDPNAKIILTGDFNDYHYSDTIKTIKGDELIDLFSTIDAKDRFSYFYKGRYQTLDNILITKNLSQDTKFEAIHINVAFKNKNKGTSDHDPVIAQITFPDQNIQEPQKSPTSPSNSNDNFINNNTDSSNTNQNDENLIKTDQPPVNKPETKKEETIASKPSTAVQPKPENNTISLTKQNPKLVSSTSLDVVIGNNQSLQVKTSADLSTFKEVRVDGQVIDKTNYDLKEGSTIVTLKASYLDTLAEGTHKLEIVSNESNTYKAHTVTVLFTIQKPKQTATHNPNWQQDLRKHNEFISKHNKETNKTLPNTGHTNNHSFLLASTLLTLVAYKLYKKED